MAFQPEAAQVDDFAAFAHPGKGGGWHARKLDCASGSTGRRAVSIAAEWSRRTWMVKRSEIVILGGLWLEGHGLSVSSETLGLSSRVQRAAPSLQMQADAPVVASYGLAKTATLTILRSRES